MELGGHSPVIVFADADPEKAADTIAAFKYRNAGQVCISPTRFYVQEQSYSKFVARFTEYAKNIKLGDGLEKGTTMGPLANPRRLDAIESFVNNAKERGGKIRPAVRVTATGLLPADGRHRRAGRFQDHDAEPFGPVAPIVSFKTFDEVVERANRSSSGSRLTPSPPRRRRRTRLAMPSNPAWSASTRSRCRRRRRRSAASRSRATAPKAASRACRRISIRSYLQA